MSAPRWTWIGAAALLMALSYGVGRWRSSPEAAPQAAQGRDGRDGREAAVAMRPLVVERAGAGASSGIDREELRAVVREELAHSAEQRGEDGGEDATALAEKAARAERSAKAATVASAAVAAGISDGLWDERDRQALREQLPHLDERATHAVLGPLFRAINAQQVKLDGPPI